MKAQSSDELASYARAPFVDGVRGCFFPGVPIAVTSALASLRSPHKHDLRPRRTALLQQFRAGRCIHGRVAAGGNNTDEVAS